MFKSYLIKANEELLSACILHFVGYVLQNLGDIAQIKIELLCFQQANEIIF